MYRFSALSILLLTLGAADVAGREWWDNSGRFRVEAEFVSSDGRTVHLRRGDGSTIAVPMARLSEADRKFVGDANRASNQKEPASSEVGETKRLVGQFLERPSRETFLAARQALIASPHYKPYSTEPLDLQAHLNASRYDLVLEKMTNDENYWLSPWGRQMANAAALGKGDVRLAVMERRNALMCVEGILSTVDEIAAHVAGRLPTKVPQGARPAIAELTTRINYNLRIGAFKMDFETGEIHFHASAPLVEDHLHGQIFWCLTMATVTMLDQFMPAILSVIYGNEEPAAALNQVMQAW